MHEDKVLTAFREKFRIDELAVFENASWVLSVRPEQLTLGSMVVSSKRGALSFGELEAKEGAALTEAMAVAEHRTKALYGAARINVICLMMKDPVLHFHIVPRYPAEIERHGLRWVDGDWPGPPTFRPATTPDAVLTAIAAELRPV